MRGESWRLRTDALSVGTGVGTEKGGGRLEARRDLSPSQRERARGQRRERSERAGPDLSGLTSFFLCPSASFPLLSACPLPDGKAVRIGTPLFLRFLM